MSLLPSFALTLLAAVFRFATPSTLGKLSSNFLPLAAIHVGALTNPSVSVVFAACVSHDYTCPVLNIGRQLLHLGIRPGRTESESLNEGKHVI